MTLQFNSGCDNDSGEITPKGRHISQHVIDNMRKRKEGHNISWDYIDTVIDRANRTYLQPDGRVVYLYKQPTRKRLYSIAVVANGNCVVTAFKDVPPGNLDTVSTNNNWSNFVL